MPRLPEIHPTFRPAFYYERSVRFLWRETTLFFPSSPEEDEYIRSRGFAGAVKMYKAGFTDYWQNPDNKDEDTVCVVCHDTVFNKSHTNWVRANLNKHGFTKK